jgi:hypothetical protein
MELIQAAHYITITEPSAEPWEDESHLLNYLLHHPEVRRELFQEAQDLRLLPDESVIVDHPLLWFPFTFFPSFTDEYFVYFLRLRLHLNTTNLRRLL